MDKHDKHHKPKHGHDKHAPAPEDKKPQVDFSDMTAGPTGGNDPNGPPHIEPHGKHVKKH